MRPEPPLRLKAWLSPGFLGGLALVAAVTLAGLEVALLSGTPGMLLVLLFGMIVRALAPSLVARGAVGIAFAGKTILRLGVALLGFRVVADDLLMLGAPALALVVATVIGTLAGGILIARFMRQPADVGVVAATSVAICGASAALAASAVLPRRNGLERETILVILVVSLLSSAVMILYPLLARTIGLDVPSTALLLGAAIHDVAQVAGAGFAVSDTVGLQAVTVKMIRVACLLPVILAIGWQFRTGASSARSTFPPFLLAFFVFAGLASTGVLPAQAAAAAGTLAGWLLAAAVSAIGLKTGFQDLRACRPSLVATLALQTAWQLTLVLGLVLLIS